MPDRADPFPEEGREAATRILGVDPGMTATGFGAIEIDAGGLIRHLGSGVLRPRVQPLALRLREIFRGLRQQIEIFAPRHLVIERPFYAKNVKSAMLLGQARGMAILAGAETGLEVQEYSPLEIKQAVVGYGRADKNQVQFMIRSLLHVSPEVAPDAADALAVALCFAHSLRFQNSLQDAMSRPCPARPPRAGVRGR